MISKDNLRKSVNLLILIESVYPDFSGGMLVVRVGSDSKQPGVPLVEGSGKSTEALTLQVYIIIEE